MARGSVKNVCGGLFLSLVFYQLLTGTAPWAESVNTASLCQLGEQYLSRGEYDKAVKAFEQAVRNNPDSEHGYAGMGRGYLKLGADGVMSNPMLLEKGVDSLISALRINPGSADLHFDLGLAWLALGNREKALQEQKSLEIISPSMAAKLATAISGFRQPPVFREAGAGSGASMDQTGVRIVGNAVLVPVTLALGGQSAQVILVLDTGASMTTITSDVAYRLGIRMDKAPVGKMRVADGRNVEARVVRIERVEAGPYSKAGMVVAVLPQHGPSLGYDGLLGMDFLRDLHYYVDFRNRVINWTP
jgi:clan AA aspartic protease (TIGR02281 family)